MFGTFAALGVFWLSTMLIAAGRRHIIANNWMKKGHTGPYYKVT